MFINDIAAIISLWPSDTIWRVRSRSTLVQVVLVASWYQSIAIINIDVSPKMFCSVHLRAISPENALKSIVMYVRSLHLGNVVHWVNMGPILGRPRWAPSWPHEPCYQGLLPHPQEPMGEMDVREHSYRQYWYLKNAPGWEIFFQLYGSSYRSIDWGLCGLNRLVCGVTIIVHDCWVQYIPKICSRFARCCVLLWLGSVWFYPVPPCDSYQIRKIVGCACVGNAGNAFPATAGKRSRHASRHVRHARAVMHAGIAN